MDNTEREERITDTKARFIVRDFVLETLRKEANDPSEFKELSESKIRKIITRHAFDARFSLGDRLSIINEVQRTAKDYGAFDCDSFLYNRLFLTIINDAKWHSQINSDHCRTRSDVRHFTRSAITRALMAGDFLSREEANSYKSRHEEMVLEWVVGHVREMHPTKFFEERDAPTDKAQYCDTVVPPDRMKREAPQFKINLTPITKEEEEMSNITGAQVNNNVVLGRSQNYEPAFKTVSYVYGTPVESLSEAQMIGAIKEVEKEIENLKTVKTKSTKIAAKIKELEAMLASIVTALDGK